MNKFKWDDNNVIDFVNWYLKVHNIPDNYELENNDLLFSFKIGVKPEKYHNSNVEIPDSETSKTILPEYDRIDFDYKLNLNKCEKESLISWLETYHKALTKSEKELFDLKCLNKKLFDDNIQLETLLSKDVSEQLQEYNDLIDKHGEISWKIHELACMLHYEKISDNKFRQEVRRLIEEHIKNK